MENVIVIIIIAAVTVYLVRRAIRNHKADDFCSSCSSSCPYSSKCSSGYSK